MVGPGLVLALAVLALGVRAETPAGLDAKGVDPRAAIDNAYGLDVRDAEGRPVTREQVLKDLKAVTVAQAAKTSYTSALPKAAAVYSALELLARAAAAFRLGFDGFRLSEILPGLPGGKVDLTVLLLLVCSAVLTTAFCRRPETTVPAALSRSRTIEVLRC